MKNFKIIITVAVILFTTAMTAQELKPDFEKQGDIIKGTFYYEDGNISQEGTYKNGKLHGEWVSYDQDGKKTAIATYTEGAKTGKWFFWNGDILTEVDYTNNQIAEVTRYKSTENLVIRH